MLDCEVVSSSVGGGTVGRPTPFYLRAKEAPQEQPCSAFGFPTIRNEERISSLWKSIVLPLSRSSESWSMTTFAPSLSKTLPEQVNKQKKKTVQISALTVLHFDVPVTCVHG